MAVKELNTYNYPESYKCDGISTVKQNIKYQLVSQFHVQHIFL
jgi:hypothetical protein